MINLISTRKCCLVHSTILFDASFIILNLSSVLITVLHHHCCIEMIAVSLPR